jgi:hypothetical protein
VHVPEALRAQEERANHDYVDYVVAWVQGLWDFITKHEATQEPAAAGRRDLKCNACGPALLPSH